MAEQIFKQPNRGRRQDDFTPDANEQNTGPQLGSGADTRGRLSGASGDAGNTLGDIDSVLNDNANSTAGGVGGVGSSGGGMPQSAARARRNLRADGGIQRQMTKRPLGGGDKDTAGKAMSGGQLSKAEESNMIGGFYKAAGVDKDGAGEGGNKLARRIKGISRRRKILAGSGVGGIAGLMMAALLVTPIYRIPALVTDLESKIGQEVNDVVETRAERMVLLYLIGKAGGNPTNYVITGSPLSDLWRTFQSRKIEKKIFEQTGIRFYKAADGVVHVEHDGRDLGRARNYDEVKKILDRGTIQTKKDFKIILNTVLPAVRFHKASIEAKSFKIRFLKGGRYATPKVPESETAGKSDAAKATKEVEALTAQQIDQNAIDDVIDGIDCTFSGSSCEKFQELDPEAQVPDADSEEGKRVRDNGTLDEVKKEITEARDEAKKEAIKDRGGGFINRMVEKLLTKVVGAVVAKTITSAIPWIGWIDLAATIQHVFGNVLANHLVTRIPIILKQTAYGAIWAAWEGYAHNTKAGKTPLSMLSALSKQVAGSEKGKAAEQSQAYHLIYDQKDGGLKISPTVGTDKRDVAGDILDTAYNNFAVRWTIRGPLEAWYNTVGKLLGLIGDLGGKLVSWLMDISGFNALMEKTMAAVFGDNWKEEFATLAVKIVTWIYGLNIDPLAKGAEMFNNLLAGAAVALNYHCRFFLGCRTLTEQQGVDVGLYLQQKHQEDMALMSLKDRMFSTDNPDSLTSTLIREAPADNRPSTILASVFSQVAKLPSSIASALSPTVRAATYAQYSQAVGLQWYGALPGDLNQDIAPEVRQQKNGEVQCPKTDPTKEFNACQADYTVQKSLTCVVEECPEFKGQ